jgi:hypothetical protein
MRRWLIACWLMVSALHRCGIASLVKRCCVLLLVVELCCASRDFVMRFLFAAECWRDWIMGVGSMMLTLVIRGSKSGVLAHVFCL